jgi:hypothetical protein
MNRIGFISVNHFWTLTHEVGFHLHIPPTALTRMSIQTALTRKSILAEKRRKKKNEEKEKVKKVFLVEKAGRVDQNGESGDRSLFMLCKLAST